ncbi:F-box protein At2g26850 isoform X1 [Ziziphus jujuba]|uniref:F-box protein At2g26850 isoform X1 n=1 Tax=Ziziphus jujuba TaxID=326968 RepID=A0A6P6FXG0_ZIZJJ|nr:F-box protein At2g26850 isoform X1 [Ziziphus jujuba]
MLLYLLITCVPFLIFLKSLPLKPLPSWATEMRLLSPFFWKEISFLTISELTKYIFSSGFLFQIPSKMSMKRKTVTCKVENVEEVPEMSVLDLPELALECILERLPPDALCSMAGVCTSLRERCMSDHLWEKHMKHKWGRIIGPVAYTAWQGHLATRTEFGNPKQAKQKGLLRILSLGWPFSWIKSKADDNFKQKSSLPIHSVMAWYLALETGRFSFPAQVYNREQNGHVGFMLSCYDAKISYDPRTDTFQARYPPHGSRAPAIENGVPWERLRAPPVDTPHHDLHISDCLNELRPGDHVEIQWRRNKEFPYGWWYGVVGHLEPCDGNENYCRCHESDTVVLEFNQYTPGSRWRHTTINRKDHGEEGNEADGFYGGIRKLSNEEEISMWRRLWPSEVLE